MKDIKYFKNIIKEKRKRTEFRDYLKEIVSFRTLGFYKNNGKISIYPDSKSISSISSDKQFQEERSNLTNKGIDYNFNSNFFDNFKYLFKNISFPQTVTFGSNENCDYSDQVVNSKNAYLSYVVIMDCENIFYSLSVKENSSNVFNSLMIWDNCDNIYFSNGIINSYNVFYSKYIINSNNIWFSSNLNGCSDCLFCENLENKSYCIENKQYTKDEYKLKKQEILRNKADFHNYYIKNLNKNKDINIGSENVVGSFNIFCNNLENAYFNREIESGRNIMFIGGKDPGKNIYDCFLNTPKEEDFYGTFSAGYGDNVYNSYHVSFSSNIYYSCLIESCSYCIGCIGLKNKSYCILNKQYTKEDWEKEVVKIFEQMETDGTLGDFFPGKLNPFYFNDTVAGLIGGFTKEEVVKDGYMWRDEEIKVDIPEGVEILNIKDLDDYEGFDSSGNWKINPEILKKVIKDEKGNYYRIVKMEYDFLQKHKLPLPRLHWLDRMKVNFGV